MGQRVAKRAQQEASRRSRAQTRLRAVICKPGPDEVMDACLMLLSSEADVEQVSTLAEAMQRCLDGRADILFVNMLSTTSRELTALAAFRSLKHSTWVVILASEEMRPVLMSMRIADEVLTATPVHHSSQPQA